MSPSQDAESRLKQFIDFFIPESLRRDPDEYRRARIIIAFSAVPVPITILVAFAYRASLPPKVATLLISLVFGAALIGLLAPLALRRTGSFTLPTNILAGYCYVLFAIISGFTGGTTSAGIFWNVVIPLCVMAIAGARLATFWFVLCLAQYAAFFTLEANGVQIPNFAAGERRRLIWLNSISNLTLLSFTIVILYERAKNAALRTLEEANRELARARDAADAANQGKTAFLANMSHEIRTPMTAILGFTDVLTHHDPARDPAAEQADAVATIRRNGYHLLEIINDLLDLSKIEVGKLEIERIVFSPASVIDDVIGLMRLRAEDRGLSLSAEYETEIPSQILGDPTRLKQVLMNLVGNGIKFTRSGGVRLVARLEPASDGPRIQLDVIDTGPGIPEERLEALFEPFVQADASTTRQHGGTGLGLAICRRLCALMGGSVGVESEPGVGSTFRVDLPTGPLAGIPMMSGVPRVSVPEERPGGEEEVTTRIVGRVLIAEDGPDNQRLFAKLLESAGVEVSIAANGEVALELIRAADDEGRPFDVVLMDMQMPVRDGYDTTRMLRAEGYAAPIIALTAHAMPGEREKCLRAGCSDFVSKPIERNDLIQAVARNLESAKRSSGD